MENASQPAPAAPFLSARAFWIFFLLIAIAGMAVRLTDTASYRRTGFDEFLYRRYVYLLDGGKQTFSVAQQDKTMARYQKTITGSGLAAMPELSAIFLATQNTPTSMCELPPTRFLYIYTAWLWKNLRYGAQPPIPFSEVQTERPDKPEDVPYARDASRRDPALAALNQVSCGFSVLLMLAGGLFAWRMLGRGAGLGVLALMAFDPLQIHLSQHAMVDGFFAFWALMCLWTTWECLRIPTSVGWLTAHTICLALMVMTKENAFFVYCALAAVVAANRWLKIGRVTPRFLVLSVVGPGLGVLALVALAGGVEEFKDIYLSLVSKAQTLEYAELTGDGPWHRYLIDLLTISPIVLCLALGALFALSRRRKEVAFLAVFVFASYLIMCNIHNGMNLRYASIWGLPLRVGAVLMLWELCARFGRRQWLAATLLIAGLCAYEGRQYRLIASEGDRPFYEVIPGEMLHQLNIIKDRKAAAPAVLPFKLPLAAPLVAPPSPASPVPPQ